MANFDKAFGIVYKSINIINNKCYIGQTVGSLQERKKRHIRDSKHLDTHFYRAMKKYGKNNFHWKILCGCVSKKELDEMEFHYIKQHDSYNNGYNMTYGGDGGNTFEGRKHTLESKKKISKNHADVSGKNNPMYGVKRTEEFKENMRGENYKNSKEYSLISPDGKIVKFKGLRDFCRKNDLNRCCIMAMFRGQQKQHKGYKLYEENM